MTDIVDIEWTPPGPGTWKQDRAHFPMAVTALMQEVQPGAWAEGYAQTVAEWGLLIPARRGTHINGFFYALVNTFDRSDTVELERRAAVSQAAFDNKIWRTVLRHWDEGAKPASIAIHRSLAAVDLAGLTDDGLRNHLHRCIEHWRAMWVQHLRFNGAAMLPVGDFVLHAARWTGRAPIPMFAAFDGYSPVSSVLPPELEPAIRALRASSALRVLLDDTSMESDQHLQALRAACPEVNSYMESVGYRLGSGFDLTNPTIEERPGVVLGRIRAAVEHEHDDARQRADVLAAEIRAEVPAEYRGRFDELLAEARLVYRLRDERGLYSDAAAAGLLRLALIELGKRLSARGRIHFLYDTLDLRAAEIDALLGGSASPTADELSDRVARRKSLSQAGAPPMLGDPPGAPLPLEGLPEVSVRVMSAIALYLDGVLGEVAAPSTDVGVITGVGGSTGVFEGPARLVRNFDELLLLDDGEVLVTTATGESFNAFLHLCGAIVTDHGSFASHAAIMGREMGIPAVVGCVNATKRIPAGARVRVDGSAGTVTILDD